MKIRPALTLVEILIVIGLVSILAVPTYIAIGNFRSRQALATSVEELAGAIRRAQMYAREEKDGKAWGINYRDDTTYGLISGSPSNYAPEAEYVLISPTRFLVSGFEIWFEQGSGTTEEPAILEMGVPSGLQAGVEVSRSGLVEARP